MKNSDIFDTILHIVAEVCEVSEDDIMHMKRTPDCIKARLFIVYYCRKAGMSSYEIAKVVASKTIINADEKMIIHKSKGIDKMYYSYHDHIHESISFSLNDTEIYNALKARYSELCQPGMKLFPTRR